MFNQNWRKDDTIMAPPGYWDNHEAWEWHPTIIKYHEIVNTGKSVEEFTQVEREIIAEAYVLHDEHFGTTVQSHVKSYEIPKETIFTGTVDYITEHLGNVLKENPQLIGQALSGDIRYAMQSFQYGHLESPWWEPIMEIHADIQQQIRLGNITDLRSYYHYMCTHHLGEVLNQGW